MACLNNFHFGKGVAQGSNCGDDDVRAPAPRRAFMSLANVQLLEEFVGFCEAKKINLHHDNGQGGNGPLPAEANGVDDVSSFRSDLNTYFGHQIPANVVDELCKLLIDSTHGKCRSCKMPTESLIISVLQILSDAAQSEQASKENTGPAVVGVVPNVNLSSGKDPVNSFVMDFPTHCSQKSIMHSGSGVSRPPRCARIPLAEAPVSKNVNVTFRSPIIDGNTRGLNDARTSCSEQFMRGSLTGFNAPIHPNSIGNQEFAVEHKLSIDVQNLKESVDFLHGLEMNKENYVLETPLVMCQGNRAYHNISSIAANAPMMNKKQRIGVAVSEKCNVGTVLDNSCAVKEGFAQTTEQGECSVRPVIVLSDDPSNSGDIRYRIGSAERFPISEQDARYYDVICGLARTHWSGWKAVQFSVLTSVTYSSLGESVKIGGRCDNFFVAGMCRYFFETVHPRQSRKHFFYPRIGGCLYTYNCSDDIKQVEKSFSGANYAFKLHSSDKLVFPIVIRKHWFVFIVDLKNKLYVFLDSFFNEYSNFQVEARTRLMNAFKECWYQYAEGFVSLEGFTYCYPEVPKQNNHVDCGIFAVKFMELWDYGIDLRDVVNASDISNIRVQMAVNMFFSPANTVDKSVVNSLFQQGMNARPCN